MAKAWREAGYPTENDQPTSAFEIRLYVGSKRILQETQPWIGDIGPEADYNRLEEQVQVIGAREEKAQNDLQCSRETVARLTGEMSLSRKRMGDLEAELMSISPTHGQSPLPRGKLKQPAPRP